MCQIGLHSMNATDHTTQMAVITGGRGYTNYQEFTWAQVREFRA